eukprot:1149075-Pelagomonas_calceolata.AAC.2
MHTHTQALDGVQSNLDGLADSCAKIQNVLDATKLSAAPLLGETQCVVLIPIHEHTYIPMRHTLPTKRTLHWCCWGQRMALNRGHRSHGSSKGSFENDWLLLAHWPSTEVADITQKHEAFSPNG